MIARTSALLALLGGLALAPVAMAQVRSELPVREVDLSDGTRRYAVPVQIGSVKLDAGLDTGSTGLRVMPNVISAAEARTVHGAHSYSYGAGVKLEGDIAQAQLTFGGLSGPGPVELVKTIGCVAEQPQCFAVRVSQADFGIQGDGLKGEGFKAILGVNMGHSDAANPFESAGAKSWIVELPRPGEASGRIILNPNADDMVGFVFTPILAKYADNGALHDAVAGCLVRTSGERQRICGALTFDSGAPGLHVVNGGLHGPPWPNGTPAALIFAEPSGTIVASEAIVIGEKLQATRLTYGDVPHADTAIKTGLVAYFAYDVLYDAAHDRIGFRPRSPFAGGPTAATKPAS
jgi:hypothetical protein